MKRPVSAVLPHRSVPMPRFALGFFCGQIVERKRGTWKQGIAVGKQMRGAA